MRVTLPVRNRVRGNKRRIGIIIQTVMLLVSVFANWYYFRWFNGQQLRLTSLAYLFLTVLSLILKFIRLIFSFLFFYYGFLCLGEPPYSLFLSLALAALLALQHFLFFDLSWLLSYKK